MDALMRHRRDPRWPAVEAALGALREHHRRAVRIVDADCGAGGFLIAVAERARAMGFTAIEGRGIGGSPALIGRAKAAARRHRDAAMGLVFERADPAEALATECEFPADIVVWHRGGGLTGALRAAGTSVIGDPVEGRAPREMMA
ncbi:SAM-dependent methyltransferase [Sphingomonas sanguinis]|jgi:SAM-dependent methyltransferase|uniref:SAM-dependent methyltransferase n=2 Tax=Sphingomonas sanguinis TaxID=33051 RepID=A0A7Y7QS23_9SPHN|nr:SAM-dependent methyltransferase [Sphingomonas sanguinis]NNG52210.1 SAM-dependent methyltransferase [Sphingomonas sanguinis]NVP29634.1 SAM-dependent methyltransferase [Sphingomonas sanguinis]